MIQSAYFKFQYFQKSLKRFLRVGVEANLILKGSHSKENPKLLNDKFSLELPVKSA